MDWGSEHLTTILGIGVGHLPTKIAGRARHLNSFFKCLGYAQGFAPGEMLVTGIDSHISTKHKLRENIVSIVFVKFGKDRCNFLKEWL